MNTSTAAPAPAANGAKKGPMSPADAVIASATMFSELGMALVRLAADNPQFFEAGRVGKLLVSGANQMNPPPEPKPEEPQPDHTGDQPAPPVTPPPAEHPVTPPDSAASHAQPRAH